MCKFQHETSRELWIFHNKDVYAKGILVQTVKTTNIIMFYVTNSSAYFFINSSILLYGLSFSAVKLSHQYREGYENVKQKWRTTNCTDVDGHSCLFMRAVLGKLFQVSNVCNSYATPIRSGYCRFQVANEPSVKMYF